MRFDYVQKKYFHAVRPSPGSQSSFVIMEWLLIIISISLVLDYPYPPMFALCTFTIYQIIFIELLSVFPIIIVSCSILRTKLILYTSGIEYIGLGYSIFTKWKEIKGRKSYGNRKS
jgi:hypothetical protein